MAHAPHPFRAPWWARNPHVQTMWGKFVRRARPVPTRLERWDTPDGDFVDLVRLDAAAPDRPRLLLLHGLEGGERSHYAQGLFGEARRRGWAMDLLLHRTCGPEMNRTRRFYHSGETSDVAFVVDRLARETPARPLGICGVSLGGNVLLKYLGERGPEVPGAVFAAIAVSVPYDLARGARHIGRGFARVYERNFLRSLRGKVVAKRERFPDLADDATLRRARSIWDFDDVVTAPVHGFRDAADYYARSSALGFLAGVHVPTLLLSAADDPFLPAAVLDEVRAAAADNPALYVEFTAHGGHVGFVGGRAPWRVEYYAERRTFEFLGERL
ncbi:YheT family hydrolase [Gemmatirosa kalamazoonensis]|nr:alpha/beta fold hydrolase [Gemmatirosa kalamazoonensis]